MLFRVFTMLLGVALVAGACGNKAADKRAPAIASAESEPAGSAAKAAPAVAPPPPVAEVTARTLLADRFRGAGFTIKYDVRLRTASYDVTVDGFDPVAGVGYEYIDVAERDTDLVASERVALAASAEVKVLVVDATDGDGVVAAAARFLAAVSKSDAKSD